MSTMLKKQILAMLTRVTNGELTVFEGNACLYDAGNNETACLHINDPRAYAAFRRGSVTSAEAYVNKWWDTPDLYALMHLAARRIEAINMYMDSGWRQLPRLLGDAFAATRRKLLRKKTSKQDISAHYDLSNDFFALFLDETLAYSCAVFPDLNNTTANTLLAASRNKLENICNKLDISGKDDLLDLGCGWGSLSFHAAPRGCPISALTLSSAQYNFLRQQPLVHDGQVTPVLSDYRDFKGKTFSKLSSVEMIEAVGEKHFSLYFQRIRAFLRDNGRALVQAITIPNQRYESARRNSDFIRQYIFPGGSLPSPAIIKQASAAAGLQLVDSDDITPHYAPTLLAWRERFLQQYKRVRALGFDERFCRLWEYYFCYCAGGFATGAINVSQLIFVPTRR